jgi:hypothetical protein
MAWHGSRQQQQQQELPGAIATDDLSSDSAASHAKELRLMARFQP